MSTQLTPEELEGHWALIDWVQAYDDGREVRPFGTELNGVISYFGGRMAALLSPAERTPFVTGGQWNAEAAEKAQAYDECLAYGGTYEYSGDQIVHHVDISLFPNWIGGSQRRKVVWDGETLSLTARIEEGTSEARTAILKWNRK